MIPSRNKLMKFPGGEIVYKGLGDIRKKKFTTMEALAVFTASPRLNDFGFGIDVNHFEFPHLMLYKKLQIKFDNEAHFQYNAFMNRISKFCNHFKLS